HGLIQARDAGEHWSDLADETIREMAAAAERETEDRYGPRPGTWAIFAMGKLGGRELTAGSDLDIIVIYDADPMVAQTWYTRFTQRLITALTAPTAEGDLYEVDMRLRPSGGAGPVAVSVPAFERYQHQDAWTWEHMALTRARVIAGPDDLKQQVEKAIADTLTRPRDKAKIAADVADMRARLAKERPSSNPWEMKHVRGGLVELESIAQFLQLAHGAVHPEILTPHTRGSLSRIAEANLLPPETADMLVRAIALIHNLTQVIRVCVEGVFNTAEASSGLRSLLARAGDAPDFPALEAELLENQRKVHEAFESIVTPS
ncbi:MAG: DUF294 nucleotidyltransferase-like domain-containing protein, partial [Nitratireductor sp.]